MADLKPLLYSRELQEGEGKKPEAVSLGQAVGQKMIANETLGYFIGRTYLFLEKIGIDVNRLRFRQHLSSEMAHYAADCWDAEIECSYGWIECVGLADRSAYDLKVIEVFQALVSSHLMYEVLRTSIPDRNHPTSWSLTSGQHWAPHSFQSLTDRRVCHDGLFCVAENGST